MALIFLIAALVCFILAIFPVPVKFNLVAAGLACWVASLLFGGVSGHLL